MWIFFAFETDNSGNWITFHGVQKDEYLIIYFDSVYFVAITITTIGYGDYAGSLRSEIFLIVLSIIIGSIYYSFFISIVGSIFSNRSMRADMVSRYVGYIEMMKREYGVPDELAIQLKAHYVSLSK